MKIEKLNKTQTTKINNVVDEWIKENFEDYYKNVSSDFVKLFDNVDFKLFTERVRELILDGFDNKTPTILSNYYFYTENALNEANRYLDEIEEKDTQELLNFDEDKELYQNEYYNDDDYYLETLNTLFNTKDIRKYFKNHYQDIYILLTDESVHIDVLDELKYYDDFNEFIEHLEGNLLYEIDKEVLLMAYFEAFQYEVFRFFTDTKELDEEIKTLVADIKKRIPKVLKERSKTLKNEIIKQLNDLKSFKQITNETIQRKQDEIKTNTAELNDIKGALK